MSVARRSSRPRFLLLLITLTAVTLMTVDLRSGSGVLSSVRSVARDAFAPVGDAVTSFTDPVANVFSSVFHYGELKDQNARLRRQLKAVQADQIEAENIQSQMRQLAALENLQFVGDIPTVTVRVTAMATSNFEKSVEINRGSDAGITVGMPVVAAGGLAGRIVEVSRTRSTVLLITDRSSSVGVRLVKSNDLGVAGGRGGSEPLRVDMVSPDSAVKIGDPVVTSGLSSSFFPPDIPVGKVSTTSKAEAGALQKNVFIRSLVNFSQLDFLKVLQWSPNGQ